LEGKGTGMQLAYVCTNYNNSKDTVSAVRSLRAGDGTDVPVVVVDNASEKSEVDILIELQSVDDNVRIIALDSNLGYFRGLNVGLAAVREDCPDIDIIVTGNNDLLFPNDFLASVEAAFVDFAAHAVISPDIVTAEGEHQNPHVISGVSKLREVVFDIYHSNYQLALAIRWLAARLGKRARRGDEDNFETAMPIVQGHGSCYLLSRKFFDEFGELWAPTFLFGEEYFLSLQLARKKQQIYYDPRVQVTHLWHASINKLPSRRQWELSRVAHRIYREHNPLFG